VRRAAACETGSAPRGFALLSEFRSPPRAFAIENPSRAARRDSRQRQSGCRRASKWAAYACPSRRHRAGRRDSGSPLSASPAHLPTDPPGSRARKCGSALWAGSRRRRVCCRRAKRPVQGRCCHRRSTAACPRLSHSKYPVVCSCRCHRTCRRSICRPATMPVRNCIESRRQSRWRRRCGHRRSKGSLASQR